MSLGSITNYAIYNQGNCKVIFCNAAITGTYTSGGESITAKQLGLTAIYGVDGENTTGYVATFPMDKYPLANSFKMKLYTGAGTEASGSVTSSCDLTVYGAG